MTRIQNPIVKALALYLVLAPFTGLPTSAQAPDHANPPAPAGPPPTAGPPETPFTAVAKPTTVRAFNDFRADTTPGLYRHPKHNHPGGVSTIESPWGERLEIRYWHNRHGITLEYDGDLKVRYLFDDTGRIGEIVAETPGQQARMPVGNRAELAYLGLLDFTEFDMSAYVLIDEALRAKHSEAFLEGAVRRPGAGVLPDPGPPVRRLHPDLGRLGGCHLQRLHRRQRRHLRRRLLRGHPGPRSHQRRLRRDLCRLGHGLLQRQARRRGADPGRLRALRAIVRL